MDAIAPFLGFGLPIAIAMLLALVAVDRMLTAGERRGWALGRRRWDVAMVGNALLEMHWAFEPQRARIELNASDRQVERSCEPIPPPNVIPVDFVRRRRC